MPKKLKEENETFQARIPKKILNEIEKEEGETNGEKLQNFMNKLQKKPTQDIPLKIRITEKENEITKIENQLCQNINELLILKAHENHNIELAEKLQTIPDYPELKQLWQTEIQPFYDTINPTMLRGRWEHILTLKGKKQDIKQYEIILDDYETNPERYKPKSD